MASHLVLVQCKHHVWHGCTFLPLHIPLNVEFRSVHFGIKDLANVIVGVAEARLDARLAYVVHVELGEDGRRNREACEHAEGAREERHLQD